MSKFCQYHEGELAVQERAGEIAIAQRNGGVIADRIMGGAIPFLAQQRFVAVGAADAEGRMWATMLFGTAGFISTVDGSAVEIRRALAHDVSLSAISDLREGAQLGLLAINLGTRQRLRVNGTIERATDAELVVAVSEAYPNCPKYIQRRQVADIDESLLPDPAQRDDQIDAARAGILDRADTLFVATRHEQRGADASHRGGRPGFIQRVDDLTLRIPDYQGNSMFNTFGNLLLDDRAGITVPDFGGGRLLQMTGRAEVLFDQPEDPRFPTGGTGRYWEFRVEESKISAMPRDRAWEMLDYSPFCPTAEPARG